MDLLHLDHLQDFSFSLLPPTSQDSLYKSSPSAFAGIWGGHVLCPCYLASLPFIHGERKVSIALNISTGPPLRTSTQKIPSIRKSGFMMETKIINQTSFQKVGSCFLLSLAESE